MRRGAEATEELDIPPHLVPPNPDDSDGESTENFYWVMLAYKI